MTTINNKINYFYNKEDNNYRLSIQDINIILDLEQIDLLKSLHKRIKYVNKDEYPVFNINGKNTSIFDILYNTKYIQYNFKNNNKFDVRKENVEITNNSNTNNEYIYNKTENCYSIKFGNINIIIDPEQYTILQNLNKRLIYNSLDDYPYYNKNYKKYDILTILYKYKKNNLVYHFINNNKYDLRSNNVIIHHQYNDIINKDFDIIKYIPGHYVDNGKDAYFMKNPIWMTKNNDYLMYCEPGKLCILCEKSYQLIKDYEKALNKPITYYYLQNGYIAHADNLYIHQIIMNYHGNGKGTKNGSVDHKNRNRLDNRLDNLEITTHQQQQANKVGSIEGTKRKRKTSAKPLPDGLTQDMMPKYVVYYREMYNKEKQLSREFFKIEKHPKLTKPLAGSKSNKLTILEKLEQIKQKLQQLETTTTEINI